MKGFTPPASPFSPPLWSHHNNTSGEAVLLSLGPGRWQRGGDREEQIKFRQKCFSPEISYTKSGRGPLILCPQRTKTRTFKTSIWATVILETNLKLSNVLAITSFFTLLGSRLTKLWKIKDKVETLTPRWVIRILIFL